MIIIFSLVDIFFVSNDMFLIIVFVFGEHIFKYFKRFRNFDGGYQVELSRKGVKISMKVRLNLILNDGIIKQLLNSRSGIRVSLQTGSDEIIELVGKLRRNSSEHSLLDLGVELLHVVGHKGRVECEQFIENTTE